DARCGGCGAGQGADRVVGQQVAPDLLLDQGRGLRAQHPSRAAQVGLELLVARLVLPPLVVSPGQVLRRAQPGISDGGDQDDQVVVPVSSRSGTSYSITRT